MRLYKNQEQNVPSEHHPQPEETAKSATYFDMFKKLNKQSKQGAKIFTQELPDYIKNQQPEHHIKPDHIFVAPKEPNNSVSASVPKDRKSKTPRKKIFQHDSLRTKLKQALTGCFHHKKDKKDEQENNDQADRMTFSAPQNQTRLAQEVITQSMRPEIRKNMFDTNNPSSNTNGYQFPKDLPSPQMNDALLLRQAMTQSVKPEVRSQLFNTQNTNGYQFPKDLPPPQMNDALLLRQAMTQSVKPEMRSKILNNTSGYQFPKDLPPAQMNDALLLREAMTESVKPEMREKLFKDNPPQYPKDLPSPQANDALLLRQAMTESVRPDMRSKLFQNQNSHKYFPEYRPDNPLSMIGSNISNIAFKPDNSERPNMSFGSKKGGQQNQDEKFMRSLDKQRTDEILSSLILKTDNEKYVPPRPHDVTDNTNIKKRQQFQSQNSEYLKLIPEILAKMNKNQSEIQDLRTMMERLVIEEKNRDEMINNYIASGKLNHSASASLEYQPRFAKQDSLPKSPHSDFHFEQPPTPKLGRQISEKSALQRQQMRRLEHLIEENKHLCRKVMEQRLRNSTSDIIDLSKSYESRSRPQNHRFHEQQLSNLDISVIPPAHDEQYMYSSHQAPKIYVRSPPKIVITNTPTSYEKGSIPITPTYKRDSFHPMKRVQVPRTKIY